MLDHIATVLVNLLKQLAALVFGVLAWIETEFGRLMAAAHIPHGAQSVLSVVVAVLFLLAVLQLFSGFIRVVLIVFLVALLAHALSVHTGPPPHI